MQRGSEVMDVRPNVMYTQTKQVMAVWREGQMMAVMIVVD
jgi:hypothetical protein